MNYDILTWEQVCFAAGSAENARKLVRSSQFTRVRRGAYIQGVPPTKPEHVHRLLVEATVPLLGNTAALAFESAAVVHGLPLTGAAPTMVHVSGTRRRGGRSSSGVAYHGNAVEPPTTTVAGFTVTTVARTVVDLARSGWKAGLVAADHALRAGMVTRAQLAEAVDGLGGSNGVKAARMVVRLADGRAESPGESISRGLIYQLGFVMPQLQVDVVMPDGVTYRCDFGWEDGALVGEFDGKAKYQRDPRGQSSQEVLWAEKRREDAIRSTGRRMVRWVFADLNRERLTAILTRAGVERVPRRPARRSR